MMGSKRSHSNSNQLTDKWGVGCCIIFMATDDVTEHVVYRLVENETSVDEKIILDYVVVQTTEKGIVVNGSCGCRKRRYRAYNSVLWSNWAVAQQTVPTTDKLPRIEATGAQGIPIRGVWILKFSVHESWPMIRPTSAAEPQSVHVCNVCSLEHFPLDVPPAHGHSAWGLATAAAHYTVSVVVVNNNPPIHLNKFISLLGHITGAA